MFIALVFGTIKYTQDWSDDGATRECISTVNFPNQSYPLWRHSLALHSLLTQSLALNTQLAQSLALHCTPSALTHTVLALSSTPLTGLITSAVVCDCGLDAAVHLDGVALLSSCREGQVSR